MEGGQSERSQAYFAVRAPRSVKKVERFWRSWGKTDGTCHYCAGPPSVSESVMMHIAKRSATLSYCVVDPKIE